MAQVEIRINGRDYRIACEDGQESHLSNLAKYLDGKVTELVEEVGQIGDTSLMVMAGLLITDELSDTRDELEEAAGNAGAQRRIPGHRGHTDQLDAGRGESEQQAERVIDVAAHVRVEQYPGHRTSLRS